MITLTNAKLVNSILGGTATVAYDKFVLSTINYNTVQMSVNAVIRITSTAQPDMQPITGSLTINCVTAVLTIEVQQLDFYRQIVLTGPQNTAVMTLIRDAQNAMESGLITVNVISGTQSLGV